LRQHDLAGAKHWGVNEAQEKQLCRSGSHDGSG